MFMIHLTEILENMSVFKGEGLNYKEPTQILIKVMEGIFLGGRRNIFIINPLYYPYLWPKLEVNLIMDVDTSSIIKCRNPTEHMKSFVDSFGILGISYQ